MAELSTAHGHHWVALHGFEIGRSSRLVSHGFLDETTQAVPGQTLEMVTGRIVDVGARAFFRLEVETIAP